MEKDVWDKMVILDRKILDDFYNVLWEKLRE